MPKRIGVIGDIHGCITELKDLLHALSTFALDSIFHVGDLIDRGPDSGAVVSLLLDAGIQGVMGNHESKILDLLKKSSPQDIKDDDKRRSALSLTKVPDTITYIRNLPRIHVVDGVFPEPIALVHGGLWPKIPLWKQPSSVTMAQLIDPNKPGSVAWTSHEKARSAGFVPWWDVWDGPETVVFGHTVFSKPQIYRRTIALDTGCVFGGHLTAIILPEMAFVQIPAKEPYCERRKLPNKIS